MGRDHRLSLDQSPLLAGISALNSAVQTVEEMADALAAVIHSKTD